MCKLKSELQHSFVVTEPELLYCTLILSVGMCTIPSLCFNTWISWVFALSCSRLYIVLNVCELLVIFLLFVMMTWRRKEINLLIPCPCWSLSSPHLCWSLQTEQASRDRYYLGFKPHRYWVAARGSTHSQEVINQPGVLTPSSRTRPTGAPHTRRTGPPESPPSRRARRERSRTRARQNWTERLPSAS
jgi:hypothetical protein